SVARMDVDLLQMGCAGREHLDQREADWTIASERDPQPAVSLRVAKVAFVRRFVQDRRRGMIPEEGSARELYRGKGPNVLGPSPSDPVARIHGGRRGTGPPLSPGPSPPRHPDSGAAPSSRARRAAPPRHSSPGRPRGRMQPRWLWTAW